MPRQQLDVYDDWNAFAIAVGGFLEERETENGLFLGVLATLKKDPPGSKPFMTRVLIEGETIFAAIYRDLKVIVSRGPDEAVDSAATKLCALGVDVLGVIGPAREAERFAFAWAKERECVPFLAMDQRIYELTEVRWPAPMLGKMRPLLYPDLDLIAGWAYGLYTEAVPSETLTREHARQKVEKRIGDGTLFGWDLDGRLVSMAGLTRPTRRTISLNAVYTPPPERRRGFATALVAALSEEGLKCGKEKCLLITDLSNPTSNSIYMKIGYRPVCDSRHYRFRRL
jgi:hypothetical protein